MKLSGIKGLLIIFILISSCATSSKVDLSPPRLPYSTIDNWNEPVDSMVRTTQFDISGRKIIRRPRQMIYAMAGSEGKIAFRLCIDQGGTISSADVIKSETTIIDEEVLRNAHRAIINYGYEPNLDAPNQQCGRFTVSMENKKGFLR